MTSGVNFNPERTEFRSKSEVAAGAGRFSTRLVLYADTLAGNSANALKEVNGGLSGTALAEEWPLRTHSLQSLFLGIVQAKLAGIEINQSNPVAVAGLEGSKYYPPTLREAYPDSVVPGEVFAVDLVNWVGVMATKGHNLLLRVRLGETAEDRVEVNVFEDIDLVRNDFTCQTDGKLLEADLIAVGEVPYRWVGERTIIHGPAESLDRINQLVSNE